MDLNVKVDDPSSKEDAGGLINGSAKAISAAATKQSTKNNSASSIEVQRTFHILFY